MKIVNFMLIMFQVGTSMRRNFDKLDINDSENNSCSNGHCDYCCLSTNKCGTLEECKERKLPIFLFELFFYVIVLVSVIILSLQCYSKGRGINSR